MPLRAFTIVPSEGPLPEALLAFHASAQQRIGAWFAVPGRVSGIGGIPSDHELVYRTLRTYVHENGHVRRFLEWGSGFGVTTGGAAQLGLEAHGIEVDAEHVAASRALLAEHGLRATIVHGSLIPAEHRADEELSDLESRTVTTAAEAYAEMDLEIEDFDVVFAYPWPTEEAFYCEIFERFADFGAVLLTYSRVEGMRAYRKVPGRPGRSR